ncbi:MAG TPA: hypothetical protein VGX25_21655 [Actinophytocola sp.]|uniref:hypothetical protein n=1 Tax=Actinophytocola sp. TaxID=1872138 RepID=UPI002DDD0E68|nr:hypothetical protein [Actinophytocola sp.]HEV2782004.1 hypothetical protein [Actinophytocola sp.]
MEIGSGGTEGPRLAGELSGLDNNLYGSLAGGPEPAEVARAFVNAGWRARRPSWTGYEVEHSWAQIEFFPRCDGITGFAGVIDPGRVDQLMATFGALRLSGSLELEPGSRMEF